MQESPLLDADWQPPRRGVSALLLIALLGVVAALGESLFNGFVYDDVKAIAENAKVHSLDLGVIFSSPYWGATLYRPLTTASFALLWQAGGGSPLPFHLANLALAVATAWMVGILLLRLRLPLAAAGTGALLFAVHPVHVEAVANVVGLAELLAAGFVLGAILVLTGSRKPGAPILSALLLLGGFLSKESAITGLVLVPAATLAVDRGRRTETLRFMAFGVLFLICGLAVRTVILGSLGGEVPTPALAGLPTGERLLTSAGLIPEWARLLTWPARLQADYSPPQIPAGPPWGLRHLAGAVILAVWASVLALSVRRRNWPVALGFLWIPVALSPVANVLFPTGIMLAERTLFLPSVGLAILVGAAVAAAHKRKAAVLTIAALLAIAGVVRSRTGIVTWRDDQTFRHHLETAASGGYRAAYVVGTRYRDDSDHERALAAFRRGWSLDQRDPALSEELGLELLIVNQPDEAIDVLRRGFALEPGREPLASRFIGLLLNRGEWDAAADAIEATTVGDPARRALLDDRLRRAIQGPP